MIMATNAEIHLPEERQETDSICRSITPAPRSAIPTRPDFIASVDFGTANCSLAYSVEGSDIESIELDHNYGERVPTALFLKRKPSGGYTTELGGRARDRHYKADQKGGDYLYFECFKMQLRHEKDITRDMTIPGFKGAKYYLIEVMAIILQHMKSVFEKHLQKTRYRFKEYNGGKEEKRKLKATDFLWVITVPAIWQDKGKQMMREAAYKAGLLCDVNPITTLTPITQPLPEPINTGPYANKLILALEPECAGLYCSYQSDNNMIKKYCRHFDQIYSKRYMIVDIGGGTVDIAIHDLDSTTNTVCSVLPPIGNEWGGTKVNEAFSYLLQIILDDPQFSRFHAEDKHEAKYKALTDELIYQQFEYKKVIFTDEGTSDDDEHEDTPIRLPTKLVEYYKEENIKLGVIKLGDPNIRYDDDNDNLILTYTKMEELFASAVQGIIQCVVLALEKSPISFDTIYLVGGFGGCQYIYNKVNGLLSMKYPQQDFKVVVPRDYKLAVSRGAVVFGQNPSRIRSRISNAYYGLEATKKYDRSIHNYTRRKYSLEHDCFVCYNIFDIFIRKNETINVSQTFKKLYTPNKADSRIVTFDIYKATDNVIYTKDIKGQPLEKVTKIGTVTLQTPIQDLPLHERIIEVTFHIGRTELQLSAVYLPTNIEVETIVNFLV